MAQDWQTSKTATRLQLASPFLGKCVAKSPRQTTILADVADCASERGVPPAEALPLIRQASALLSQGGADDGGGG